MNLYVQIIQINQNFVVSKGSSSEGQQSEEDADPLAEDNICLARFPVDFSS